ncbi:X-Pro aminopeptidase [Gracilaria domingensis]|nr:X-Pro aminopeptidase [Gracilaria domingensis]
MRTTGTTTVPSPNRGSFSIERQLSQPTSYTHAHLMSSNEVTPGISRVEYMDRRARVAADLPNNSVTIFPSNPQKFMSEDVPYLYHHNTDLMYLCGMTEPGSFLVVERFDEHTRFTLFVEPRDASREVWEGPLCGTGNEIRAYFGVDRVQMTKELPKYISMILSKMQSFHFEPSINTSITSLLQQLETDDQKALVSKWSREYTPKSFVNKQRVIKSGAELDLLRQAAKTISSALTDAMAKTKLNGTSKSIEEKFIEATIEYSCKARGSFRMAFPSVVASGSNSTTLHYMVNNSIANSGDFVMVDAGCEVHGYCSDVSRSWPVSGSFSAPQRDLYELVLDVQKQCIALAKEGSTVEGDPASLDGIHLYAVRRLTDGLMQLGFMKGHTLESAVTTGEYSKYFPHAIGHYLGMDVHDTHHVPKSTPLKENMVITIEPGLYCRADDISAPVQYRGIGMRIEDDIVVGSPMQSPEVLSKDVVKEVGDVEALVGSS